MPKRLVIFVEGKGDVKAVPALAKRVVDEIGAHDAIFVDPEPFRVRGVGTLVKNNCSDWHRWLSAALRTRRDVGAVLLALDGDLDNVPKAWTGYVNRFRSDFCACHIAAMLGEEARAAGAGAQYSVATVFAMKEFEAWLLAGVESLRGKSLAGGRGSVPNTAACREADLEAVRDAKGRLKQVIPAYDESLDQGVLAREVGLQQVRDRCRSFCRFCSAIQQMVDAVRGGNHVVTPPLLAR